MPLRHLEERSLDKYFDSIRHLPLLTAEEERINGRLWQNDHNPEGLRKLVEGNLRFVVKESRKFEQPQRAPKSNRKTQNFYITPARSPVVTKLMYGYKDADGYGESGDGSEDPHRWIDLTREGLFGRSALEG